MWYLNCALIPQLYALEDGRLWVRHDLWHKSNWIVENGLAWEGPNGPLGRVSFASTVPLGNNVFFVSGGQHESEGWRDSSRTFFLNMNASVLCHCLWPLARKGLRSINWDCKEQKSKIH